MRIFDIIFSILAILMLLPFLLALGILLKITGEGEVFYIQERVGRFGNKIKVIKFSTMLKNSPEMKHKNITIKNDPRILPLGKFLRDTKINELPQLINVLKGDMSLVGPRPLTEDAFYKIPNKYLKKMSSLKPGLSGLASVILRNEEEILFKVSDPDKFHKEVLNPYKARLEIWYDKNRSFFTYFLIIILTFFGIFFKKQDLLKKIFLERPEEPNELAKIKLLISKNKNNL